MSIKQFPIEIAVSGIRSIYLSKEGCFHNITLSPESKCVIFPKGKTTWEGFVPPVEFKDGDVLVHTQNQRFIMSIYHKRTTESIIKTHCILWDKDEGLSINMDICCYPDNTRLATEEEKAKLFKAIKDNGYCWNGETKTLKKLVEPKFKIGDEIVKKNSISNSFIVSSVSCDYYGLILPNNTGVGVLNVSEQDEWELISSIKPKFKVGDRIKYIYSDRKVAKVVKIHDKRYELDNGKFLEFQDENAYEISYDKFDINTLKPFDKVLVKTNVHSPVWSIDFYGRYNIKKVGGSFTSFAVTGGKCFQQCIPYEGNEHLLGTSDDCDDYYKTWD